MRWRNYTPTSVTLDIDANTQYLKEIYIGEAKFTRDKGTCMDISADDSQFMCSECECTVVIPILWGQVIYCPDCGRKIIR